MCHAFCSWRGVGDRFIYKCVNVATAAAAVGVSLEAILGIALSKVKKQAGVELLFVALMSAWWWLGNTIAGGRR